MPMEAVIPADTDLTPRYIAGPVVHSHVFSIVTLVANQDRYDRLVASFRKMGFTPDNTELLAIDNRDGNQFDGFTYLRRAMLEASGEYIVLTHDDVELIHDGFPELVAALEGLTAIDPNWAIAGNAGGDFAGELALHIDDPHGVWRIDAPQRCQSIDENFMVVRRDRIVLHSLDLEGFHFYGSDLCLQAEIQGGSAYVVPFLLRHNSGGNADEAFRTLREQFVTKYSRYFRNRAYRMTTGTVPLGGEPVLDLMSRLYSRMKQKLRL